MFWSANYIVVRELNLLFKEGNVTLSQVLEADDILQECKADNKNLIQFLTRPDILAELITLITEEPPPHVELMSQYRHASIACEVLTSQLSTLSDRLSMDVTQMNRLCDFLNKDPPLNPLLASYFSKTIEMLLERSPTQDWYLYHIVCLRVLDFFKSRRDFLPNLLRHMSTSAIADTFKYFIRLDDLFNKIIMEWFEEHQLLENLVCVVCGTYAADDPDRPEKGQRDGSEKQHNHHEDAPRRDAHEHAENSINSNSVGEGEAQPAGGGGQLQQRLRAVASANAAALLCDVVGSGCASEGCAPRGRTAWALQARLRADSGVRLLLQAVFTSPAAARASAVLSGCRLLLALLARDPIATPDVDHAALELALAPHLPLLHHALLHDPRGEDARPLGVGLPRVTLAALVAQLALAEHEDVCTTLLTLGTPAVLVDMMFSFPDNNFLHGQVHALVSHALVNTPYRELYGRHLLLECDLLTRLMDVFEENENKKVEGQSGTRSAYMGHVIMMLESIAHALEANDGELVRELPLPDQLEERWRTFSERALHPLLLQRHTPLGGYYPAKNIYEVKSMADTLAVGYDYNEAVSAETCEAAPLDHDINELGAGGAGGAGAPDFEADELAGRDHEMESLKNRFLEIADRRAYDDDTWECAGDTVGEDEEECGEEVDLVRRAPEADGSLWEGSPCAASGASGGWASFGGVAFAAPVDPFAASPADPFAASFEPSPVWPPAAPPLPAHNVWERSAREAAAASGGWASFGGDSFAAPADPFADAAEPAPAWQPAAPPLPAHNDNRSQESMEHSMRALRLDESLGDLGELGSLDKPVDDAGSVELANNLLHAMSQMAPHDLANIVNANLDLPLVPRDTSCLPAADGSSSVTDNTTVADTVVDSRNASHCSNVVDSSPAVDKPACAADSSSGDNAAPAVDSSSDVDSNANTASCAGDDGAGAVGSSSAGAASGESSDSAPAAGGGGES